MEIHSQITYIKVNGEMLCLEQARDFLKEAGRRIRRLHRFIRGWCKKRMAWVTACLGVVKDRATLDVKNNELVCPAKILLSNWLDRVGPKKAMSVVGTH